MLIDPFTIVAQAINFLILIFLLWRFLYHPVIKAMDKREEDIKDRLKRAEDKDREAEQKSRDLDQKLEEIDRKRDELLDNASRDAEEKRKSMIREARQDMFRSSTSPGVTRVFL